MLVGTEESLILALAHGPAFGLELIDRVREASFGELKLNRGGAYVALARLERRRLVRSWTRRVGRAGRPRRYYELTHAGIVMLDRLRRALGGLVDPVTAPTAPGETRRMAARLRRAFELSASGARLREAGRRAGL